MQPRRSVDEACSVLGIVDLPILISIDVLDVVLVPYYGFLFLLEH